MAAKPFDLHPEALEEWKSAVAWYLERNKTAAVNFVAEVDQAADLIAEAPHRWPKGLQGTRKSFCNASRSRLFTVREKPTSKSWPSHMGIGARDIGRAGSESNGECQFALRRARSPSELSPSFHRSQDVSAHRCSHAVPGLSSIRTSASSRRAWPPPHDHHARDNEDRLS
jgi:plasmid stabilization system protein ParE